MSDLAAARTWARHMARAQHVNACLICHGHGLRLVPTPGCAGCMPKGERAMWVQIADEIDAYLANDPDVVLQGSDDDTPLWPE